MSRILFAIFSLIFFIVLPFFNLTLAAEPCQGYRTEGRTISYFNVDEFENRLSHINDGVGEVRIKFENLPPGWWYRLELPKFGPAYATDAVEVTSPGQSVVLKVTDGQKLENSTHIGNLQRSRNNDWNPVTKTYNEAFCREVRYTVGYPKEECKMRIIPPTPAENQRFLLDVSRAPKGSFAILKDVNNPVFGGHNPGEGDITIGNDGRGITSLMGPWEPGKYTIYLAPGALPGQGTDISKRMCSKPFEIIPASSFEPAPSCGLFVNKNGTNTDFVVKAFNLKLNTLYGIDLDQDGEVTHKADIGSGLTSVFDYTLITNPGQGRYIATVKESGDEGKQCDVAFSIDPNGSLIPDSVTSITTCQKNDPSCTNSSGASLCIPIGAKTPSGVRSALGCIPTEPKEFVAAILRFAIGIGGGLAFLMMLLGAFQMITSAGNPDTLHAARERLTSAIIGLLMIIFAVLLLQIIGVSILNLPGFK